MAYHSVSCNVLPSVLPKIELGSTADLLTETNVMARNLLSARSVQTAKVEDGEWRNDGDGLKLRVRSSSKDWYFIYRRNRLENEIKLHIGPTTEFSLEEARRKADVMRKQRATGIDPKIAREEAERQASISQQIDSFALPRTVNDLFVTWQGRDLASRKDGGAEITRAFHKDVLPFIGSFMLTEVRKGHIAAILDQIVERGSNRMANRTLSDLRQFFGFAISRDWMVIDPTARMKKTDFGGRELSRERNLSQEEVRELCHKLPESGLSEATQAAIWIMLATACRVGEITRARWPDVDFEQATWLIPDEHSKNGKSHLVHLSRFALSYFKQLHLKKTSDTWVYPAQRLAEGHLCLKTIQKQIKDRQRATALKGRAKSSQCLLLKGGEWTAHDLRRTASTLMGELGVRPDVIDRCQNHIESSRITKTYQQQQLLDERKQAFALLGERLHMLTSISSENVVPLCA